jgi:restriction system protein
MAWAYQDVVQGYLDPDRQGRFFNLKRCIFCCGAMTANLFRQDRSPDWFHNLQRCTVCGWWQYATLDDRTENGRYHSIYGQLKALDLRNISTPVSEVRSYLAAKYASRFTVDPILFEQTVAAVFRDVGYRTRVTARSSDLGVDVFLEGPNNSLIGVQVKRWIHAIDVEQVTALTGALLINGCTRGVFVTTSRFRPGAVKAAALSSHRGLPMELLDAQAFYEVLKIAQASVHVDPLDPEMPWNRVTPTYFVCSE